MAESIKIIHWVDGVRYEQVIPRHLIEEIDTITINPDGTIGFAPIKVTAKILR